MKNLSFIFINILLIITLSTSCSTKSTKKIGLLIPVNTVQRYIVEGKYIQEKAKEHGYDLIIEYADNNDALQIEQAKALIDKVDGICVIPVNGITAAEIVRQYKSAGKPIVAYNRMIQNSEPDYYVTGDNDALAQLMINTAVKYKPNGNYYVLGGDKFDINGLQLQQAIDSELLPYEESGQINVVFRSLTQDWDQDMAASNLRKAINLSGIKPDAVIAAYDGIAEKSMEVLRDIYGEVGNIVVTGQDAELRAIRSIARGEQTMTAYHSPKNNGYACAEAIVALIEGKKANTKNITYTFNGLIDVPTIKIAPTLITKDNIDEVLIKGGIFTSTEVYN